MYYKVLVIIFGVRDNILKLNNKSYFGLFQIHSRRSNKSLKSFRISK